MGKRLETLGAFDQFLSDIAGQSVNEGSGEWRSHEDTWECPVCGRRHRGPFSRSRCLTGHEEDEGIY